MACSLSIPLGRIGPTNFQIRPGASLPAPKPGDMLSDVRLLQPMISTGFVGTEVQ
jgi:hypothetical protein